jgi:DUF1365 family protein
VTIFEIKYVLKNGYLEGRRFAPEHHSFKYQVRFPTMDDDKDLRVVVALDRERLRVVTVINKNEPQDPDDEDFPAS